MKAMGYGLGLAALAGPAEALGTGDLVAATGRGLASAAKEGRFWGLFLHFFSGRVTHTGLTQNRIRLLERRSVEFRLLNQDTFYWGTLKNVGNVYMQVVADVLCSLAFAKVYTTKMPVTAADLLYDRVLPFYEAWA